MNFLQNEISNNIEKYEQILEKIKEFDNIIVFRHIAPDYDALGCQFGLETWLKDNFPEKTIKTAGDNHVKFSGPLFPYVDRIYDEDLNKKTLGFILDVGDEKRIADPRFKMCDFKIKIDHHANEEEVADLSILETDKSSCSEIIATMLNYFESKNLNFSKQSAEYLYIGMVGDNGRFLFGSTQPSTFEIAAIMQNKGINIVETYEKMYRKQFKELEFIKFVLSTFKISPKGVCYYVLTQKDLDKLGLTCDEGKEYVNFFSDYEGIKIWSSITEDITEPCFRISLRSRNYCVSDVAKKFKGGGHRQAAGCQITDLTELPNLISALEEVIDKNEGK